MNVRKDFMKLPEAFLEFEEALNQKEIYFDNTPRSFDFPHRQLKRQVSKKFIPHETIPFSKDKIIYSRIEVKDGLRNFIAPKFGIKDSWINHYTPMVTKLSELNIQDYCNWFIAESFRFHKPDLRLLDNGSIYVIGGNHRIALLDVLGYRGSISMDYFSLQRE